MALRVWLPLTGTLENKGISNLQFTNEGATVNTAGKIGSCYTFNNNRIYTSVTTDFTSQFNTEASLSIWIKLSTSHNAWAQTVTFGTLGTNWNDIKFGIDINGNGIVYASTSTGSSYTNVASVTNIKDNIWHHVAITYKNTTLKVYIDGALSNTRTTAVTPAWSSCNLITIGGNSSEKLKNNDSLNDFRVYDHCLSAAEVKEISQGLVLHYKLDGGTYSQPNLLPCGNTYTSSSPLVRTSKATDGAAWVSNSAFEATPSTTYTISVECDGTLSNAHGRGNLAITDKPWSFWLYICNTDTTKNWSGGSYDTPVNLNSSNNNFRRIGNAYVWTYTLSSTQKYISVRTNTYSDGTNNITVKFWNLKIEKGNVYTPQSNTNSTTIADNSGYGHNGTAVTLQPLTSDTPRYSAAYTCNGNVSHRIYCNSTDCNFTDNFSFAVWCKANHTGTAAQYLFTVGRADTGGYGYGIQNNGDTNLYIRFGNAGYNVTIVKNEWTHIAFTKTGNTIKIYKNGVIVSTNTFSGTLPTYSDGKGIGLGCFHYTGGDIYPAYGALSDFRIYCTALSADDILSLYHTAAKVDNLGGLHTFELNENSGNEPNAKFVNNSATSVSYDAITDTYTIVSPVGTSSWGYGVRLADTPALWVPYGKAYRWTAEVFVPIALTVNTDYNNTASTTWSGNDNDLVSARLASSNAIQANTWTRITRGSINTNTNNTSQLSIRDYSSLGLVTNGQSNPVTWKVRNLQWYLIEDTFETKIKKTGQTKSSHFSEMNFNKFDISKKNHSVESFNLIER